MGETQVKNLGDVSFHLMVKHDFEWLRNLGKVFCVFDQQDSGNICFGIEIEGVKKGVYFSLAEEKTNVNEYIHHQTNQILMHIRQQLENDLLILSYVDASTLHKEDCIL